MKHGPPSLARLIAWSALLLGLSVGGTACGDRTPVPVPPARELPDAERSTVEVSQAQGVRATGRDGVRIQVTVRKADGSAMPGQVVTVAASGEGNTLGQPLGPTNADGVVTATLASSVPGIKTVTASVAAEGGPVTLAAHPTVEFVSLTVPRLVFSAAPTSGSAGRAPGAFEVTVQDAQGQTLTSANNTVTVLLGTGSPAAELKGTLSVAAVNGVARFSSVVLEKAGTGYVLVANAAGLASVSSAPFDVRPAEASRFVLTGPTGMVKAGTSLGFTATALDAFGNTATGYAGTVRVTSNDAGAVLPADHVFTASEQGRYAFKVTLKQAGPGRTVTVTDTANAALKGSAEVSVVPAALTKLVFDQQPVSTGAGQTFEVRVALTDDYGNRPAVSLPQVTLSLNKGSLTGGATVAPVNGVATFPGLSITKADTGYVLTASAPGLPSVTSNPFDITALAVSRFVLTAASTTAAAGAPTRFTLQALDALGNPSPSYLGTVRFASTDPTAVLPADHAFTAADRGVYAFDGTLKKAGRQSVSATDTSTASLTASVDVTVTAAAVSTLVFTQQPVSTGAGQTFEVRVELRDVYGNRSSATSSQVFLALNKGSFAGGGAVAPVDGVATFPGLSIAKADTGYVLVAYIPGLPSALSNSFDITAGAPTRLGLTAAATTVTAGAPVRFTLQALDAQGNPAPSYRGTVRFASTDTTAVLPAEYTFTEADRGVYAFDGTLKKAGRQSVSATDTVTASFTASVDVTVTAAAASTLAFNQQPVTTGAGQTFVVRVELRDAYGNRPSVTTPQVTLTINKGTLTGTKTVSPVAGLASFSALSITKADTGYVLTASATGLPSVTSNSFDITAGAPSKFTLTAAATTTAAGAPVRFTLQVLDSLSNPAVGYRGTVRFASADTTAALPADYTFTAADQGTYAFDGTLKKAGRQSVSATDTTTASLTASVSVDVTAAAASTLAFTQQPVSTGVSQSFEVKVELRDAYGNRPSVTTPQVTLSLNKGTLAGTKTVSPVAGLASFPGLSIAPADTGYVLTASATGLTSVSSNSFNITENPVSKLVLESSATTVAAGTALTLTVTAQDAFNNRVAGYTGTVRFTVSDAQATKPPDTAFTSGDAGQKTFPLTLKTAGSQTVSVSDGTRSASVTVRVEAGAVAKLVFRSQPTNTSVRRTLSEVRVALLDAYDNPVSATTPQIELGLVGGNNAATLSGTVKIAPVVGVAAFSNLSVDQQGTDFWLVAMAGTLNSVESARFTIVDNVAPGTATLTVAAQTSSQVDLAWTAVGDDGSLGTAASQEMRYSTSPIDAINFNNGTLVPLGAPQTAGTAESKRITGLTPATRYYFALRVTDDAGNTSLALVDTTLSTDACAGYTCTPSAPACAADGVSRTTYTASCVEVNGAATCQQTPTTTACSGTNPVCFNATCDSAARPTSDQMSFTEVMHTPSATTTEYVELTNLTDSLLNLNGLTVSYENSAEVVRSFLVGTGSVPVVVGRKGRIVLAANKDLATNGGVAASYQYPASIVLDGSGSLSLSNGDTPITLFQYSSSFPQGTGKAVNLSSLIVGTRAAIHPWYWCDSTDALSGGDYGTPQAANASCGVPASPTLSTCFIQGPKTLPSTAAGTATTITGRFRAPGVTDRNTAGNDNHPYVVAELGYGPSTSNAAAWTWAASPLNSEYTATVSQDDEVTGTLNIATPGDYKYGFRFAFRDPATNTLSAYTYCGQSDISDPANGVFGTVTITGGTTPATDHVVISEFAPQGPSNSADEFIELYNPTNAEVDIAGWKIQYKRFDNSTGYTNSTTLPAGAKIAAHGFYLVTSTNYAGSVVGDFSSGGSISMGATASGGNLRLGKKDITTAFNDPLTVDRVGYGTAAYDTEGSPTATIPPAAGSFERKAVASSTTASMEGGTDALRGNGYDSNNNANDFVVRNTRNPQNKASALEAP